MVAPLRRKNTLESTGFAVDEAGFAYKGKRHRYEDVVETLRFRQRLETKVVFVGSDFTHAISVVFVMRSGDRVQLTEQPTWFSKVRPEYVDRIEEIFSIVSAKTFECRAQKYLDQLREKQYFEYSGWQFRPRDRTIINMDTHEVYSATSDGLLRSFGFIELRRGTSGIGATVAGAVGGKVGINTLSDTDVFFDLLKQYFGLRWNDA